MSADPWTNPDPKPGDSDADLTKLDPRYVEDHEGDPDAKLIVLSASRAKMPSDSNASPRPAARLRRTSSPNRSATLTARPRSPLSQTAHPIRAFALGGEGRGAAPMSKRNPGAGRVDAPMMTGSRDRHGPRGRGC